MVLPRKQPRLEEPDVRRTKLSSGQPVSELRRPNLHKTSLCRLFAGGECPRGSNCTFAHGQEELRTTQEFYKTRLCDFHLRGHCRHKNCRHAHGEAELYGRRAHSGSTCSSPSSSGSIALSLVDALASSSPSGSTEAPVIVSIADALDGPACGATPMPGLAPPPGLEALSPLREVLAHLPPEALARPWPDAWFQAALPRSGTCARQESLAHGSSTRRRIVTV